MAKRLFNLYIIIFCILPTSLFFIFGWHSNFVQVDEINIYLSLSIFFISIITVYLATYTRFRYQPLFNLNTNNLYFTSFLFLIGFSFLILAIIMKSKFGVSFRHSGPNLSQAGPIAVIFSIIKGFIAPIFIIYARIVFAGAQLNLIHKFNSLSIALAFIIFPIAAFDVIYILLFFLFSFKNSWAQKIFRMKVKRVLLIGIPMGILVILLGLSTKVGFENLYGYLENSGVTILKYLQYRNGVFFFSSMVNFSSPDFFLFNWIEGNKVTFDMLQYRTEVILGNAPDKNTLSNLNVLNFKNVFNSYNESMEIGASPGLLLCFHYFMPFPVSLCLLYLFTVIISSLLNFAFPRHKPSYFLAFCIMIAFFGVINSPIHVFTALGPDILKVIFLLLSLSLGLSKKTNY